MTLDEALERWAVYEPGALDPAFDLMPGWWKVANDDGIVAYFVDGPSAYRHRLAMINRELNP